MYWVEWRRYEAISALRAFVVMKAEPKSAP
jgi:hypothetical protein